MTKGAYWALTPWRIPQRLEFIRQRDAALARAAVLEAFVGRERALMEARDQGHSSAAAEELDLFDDASVADAAGAPVDAIVEAAPAGDEVVDALSAAKFCIGLLRERSDVRQRFPRALTGGISGEFAEWIKTDGGRELGLSAEAAALVVDVLGSDVPARARQVFLSADLTRSILPHGLTPAGLKSLFWWFMRYGAQESSLQLHEVWWLFLEAVERPHEELQQAFHFTPDWQRRHPDGSTVFGREAFAAWFARAYGARGDWLDTTGWPEKHEPAAQLRTAFWAREAWRRVHPRALADASEAQALLDWLRTPDSGVQGAASRWCNALGAGVATDMVRTGANVMAHFCYPSGLRVSAESLVAGMTANGVPVSLRDIRTDVEDDPCHVRFDGMEHHDVTIVHTQPEPFFREAYRRAGIFERVPRSYRIAYWYWEFDSAPESWSDFARDVDEVWVATEFVARGVRKRVNVPVRTLFPGVKLGHFTPREKTDFGLDESAYVFLFTFHMMSVMERKNPLGLIRAFKKAFTPNEDAALVLKVSFGERHPQQLQELREACEGARITVIDEVFSPDKVLSLMHACDAYVSLHRSEGLGLTMAEAMLMGKPVIATGFSSNVDFMDDSNSLLVPYELVKLAEPIPPYDAGMEWAEPSTEQAAAHMRKVYENREWARELGARARESAMANLSVEAAGQRILQRLEEIRTLRSSGG